MQSHVESKPKSVTLAELESCVPAGSASHPIAKLKYRLSAPLRWWSRSILRILAIELCSFPLRILTILRTPSLRWGTPIPYHLEDHNLGSLEEVNNYGLACIEGTQDLRKQRRVISVLEYRTYCQGFRDGATWGLRKTCSGRCTQAPVEPS